VICFQNRQSGTVNGPGFLGKTHHIMKKYTCKKTFDPMFGFNIIQAGEVVLIRIDEDQYGEPDIRLIKSVRNTFPGYGSRIRTEELNNHFQLN
jgi:hypothetical protein